MQISDILEKLQSNHNLRTLTSLRREGLYVFHENHKMLNFAGNDYLNLADDTNLKQEFLSHIHSHNFFFSSSSSRSLSGNFEIYNMLESFLANFFTNKECLLFNSGYHLNVSCISALSNLPNTLFLADKLIHASMIDGLLCGNARFKRFAHNDMEELENLLESYANDYERIIILTEALFSMDGDFAHIKQIVKLKQSYQNVFLYVDEAHSVGAIGVDGLGLLKDMGIDYEIDFIIFTFGKAIASVGACVLCANEYKDFFINKARGLIYSTALPPINIAFSAFILSKILSFQKKRENLKKISHLFKSCLLSRGIESLGEAHIVSLIIGDNEKAIQFAKGLMERGFYAPAIREPSVPKGKERIRFSLNSDLKKEQILDLQKAILESIK
ncbi:8-amino-7-oxononanoate synthase [Helicobacter didelphidarum]|uniref:8-amino-7-oxononanoate synthase n=1 Tax=Helicobacter didelphidarum TaxID=2040648 RepID=A0A3D8IFH4_9HELI|nr:pyridoxal phosphate-dependent aminotransferase family protein [Helicobacter didelphidarum]RDU63464.1 8-amino-7-oxononanoate synthase [Helicobacter didelphidarum]